MFPPLLPSFFDNQEEMDYGRLPRGALPDQGCQRLTEDGTVPNTHRGFSRPQTAYEDGIQGRGSNQPGHVSHAAGGPILTLRWSLTCCISGTYIAFSPPIGDSSRLVQSHGRGGRRIEWIGRRARTP